jgi:hypothetical protein
MHSRPRSIATNRASIWLALRTALARFGIVRKQMEIVGNEYLIRFALPEPCIGHLSYSHEHRLTVAFQKIERTVHVMTSVDGIHVFCMFAACLIRMLLLAPAQEGLL